MDIENQGTAEDYLSMLRERIPNCLASLPLVRTPSGGMHLYYRHKMKPCPGKHLASRRVNDETELLVETRGQGQYVVSCFATPEVHPLNRPYELVQGNILDIPTLEDHERRCLWLCAKALDEMPVDDVVKPPATLTVIGGTDLVRPGDDLNARGDWASILEPTGWWFFRVNGKRTEWTRPGKGTGCSTTTGATSSDLLFCFSTSATPLEAGKWYTKFSAYAVLHHSSSLSAAARD